MAFSAPVGVAVGAAKFRSEGYQRMRRAWTKAQGTAQKQEADGKTKAARDIRLQANAVLWIERTMSVALTVIPLLAALLAPQVLAFMDRDWVLRASPILVSFLAGPFVSWFMGVKLWTSWPDWIARRFAGWRGHVPVNLATEAQLQAGLGISETLA